jgi:hypothetical protein
LEKERLDQQRKQWLHSKEVEQVKHGLELQKHKVDAAEKVLGNPDMSEEVKSMATEYLKNLFKF